MDAGTVVILREGRSLRPAVVVADRGKKLDFVLAGGKTTCLPAGRMALSLGRVGGPFESAAASGAWLQGWTAEVEVARSAIEIELVWELLAEDETEAPLSELVELLHEADVTPAMRAATFLWLEADSTWFKRRGDAYRPRSAEVVQQRIAADRKAADRQAARAAFSDRLTNALRGAASPLAEADAAFVADLRTLALGAEGSPEALRALKLLGETAALPASTEGAFRALVALGVFGRDENLALLAAGIHRSHPEAAEVASRALPDAHLLGGRTDLRGLETFTVDEAWTTDPDDALSVAREPDGGLRVWIHITHAASFLPPGGAVDDGAASRGASIYLPDERLPMLPPACEERLALLAGCDRAALTLELRVGPDGDVTEERTYPTLIHVDENLTYAGVDERLADPGSVWSLLWSCAQGLRQVRAEAGAVQFSLPEVRLEVAGGEVDVRRVAGDTAARALIAELMILTNARWAALCSAAGVPVVYRRQDPPGTGLPPRDTFSDPWVYFFNIRRHLLKGRLSTQPAGHSGLGLACYLQATSPLRRYQDLVTQRQLTAHLAGLPVPYAEDAILEIAASADLAARAVGRIERTRVDHWVCRWLESRVGQTLRGSVLGRLPDGRTQVLLADVLRELPLRVADPLEPGDAVEVRLDGVNVFERHIHCSYAGGA